MVDIRDLGEDIYLVNGKVIQLGDGVADLSSECDREWLGHLADCLYIHKFDRPAYGEFTGCFLLPLQSGDSRCSLSSFHFFSLPENVKTRLKEEVPSLVGKI